MEDVQISRTPELVARYVGRRTVYTFRDIQGMSRSVRPIHAMLFRQDRLIQPGWTLETLHRAGVVSGWPQSITRVGEEGRRWVHELLAASH